MRLTIKVVGDDQAVAWSLRAWLAHESLSYGDGEVLEVPPDSNMGSVPGSLIFTVESEGAVRRLAAAIVEWLQHHQGAAVEISRPGRVITLNSGASPASIVEGAAAIASPPPGPEFPTER